MTQAYLQYVRMYNYVAVDLNLTPAPLKEQRLEIDPHQIGVFRMCKNMTITILQRGSSSYFWPFLIINQLLWMDVRVRACVRAIRTYVHRIVSDQFGFSACAASRIRQ